MEYNEYLNKFREAQLSRRISAIESAWSKEDFEFFTSPLPETSELRDDIPFRLSYQHLFLRLRRAIEKGIDPNKEEQLREWDRMYLEAANNLNLL